MFCFSNHSLLYSFPSLRDIWGRVHNICVTFRDQSRPARLHMQLKGPSPSGLPAATPERGHWHWKGTGSSLPSSSFLASGSLTVGIHSGRKDLEKAPSPCVWQVPPLWLGWLTRMTRGQVLALLGALESGPNQQLSAVATWPDGPSH